MDEPTLQIEKVKNIRDIVYDSLRRAILEGQLKPGERVVEKEYADKLRISRTPVREALRKLEIEGLLEYIPRKGDVVKAFDEQEISEVYAIRKVLEVLAMEYIIANITPQETTELQQLIADIEGHQNEGRMDQVFSGNKAFNELLLRTAKAPKLTGMIQSLKEYLGRYRRITLAKPARRDVALKEHAQILQAVIDKDLSKAKGLVLEHINHSQQELFAFIQVRD